MCTSMVGEKWAAGAMVGAGGCGDSSSGVGRGESGSPVSHPRPPGQCVGCSGGGLLLPCGSILHPLHQETTTSISSRSIHLRLLTPMLGRQSDPSSQGRDPVKGSATSLHPSPTFPAKDNYKKEASTSNWSGNKNLMMQASHCGTVCMYWTLSKSDASPYL